MEAQNQNTDLTGKPLAVAVFCGAHAGSSPRFAEAARDLAQVFHTEGWSLIYGAGTVGLMGEISRTLVQLSGTKAVHGIIPKALVSVERARNPSSANFSQREQDYGSLTIVEDMHERKSLMSKEAAAFVALPGGYGTLEELMEIITWNFLGIHSKPIVLFNVDGYYDDIFRWVRKAAANGFVAKENENIVVEAKTAAEVVCNIKGYKVAGRRHNLDWKDN